jgi:Arf-GAP/coiled-coil/ANK repeat/PH domain-containing protein
LEEDADVLRDRTVKFSKGCNKYRDGLEDAYANEVNWSESIKGLYGSLDDSFGNDVGGAILDKFMSAVQEIGDARGMLLSNVEVGRCTLNQVDP